MMGSEDFHHLVIHNSKKEYCYIMVGVADPTVYANALKAGKQTPYNMHNGNYIVDLTAIPFGTKIATNSLIEIFKTHKGTTIKK